MPQLSPEWQRLIGEILTFIVGAGWLILIGIGLEPDKPLSGGIPGHVDLSEVHGEAHESPLDHLGEVAGWVAFGTLSVLLVFVLVWIFRVHG